MRSADQIVQPQKVHDSHLAGLTRLVDEDRKNSPSVGAWYIGARTQNGAPHVSVITIVESTHASHEVKDLPHIQLHSPDGFEWGYGGSGPADLALSILAHALGNREQAKKLHQWFKWEFVRKFRFTGFQLSQAEVLAWVEAEEAKEKTASK